MELQATRSRSSSSGRASSGISHRVSQSTERVRSYRAPIIIVANPWKTWVAWISTSLLCVTVCLVVIILNPKLWYLSITLAAFGGALSLQAKREKYVFDINSGRCTLDTLSILGRELQQYWFHEIKEVSLEESTDTQGGTEVDLYLILRSGRKISMLGSHLCGLEAKVKRQVWSDISEYLQVSQSQNSLEFLEENATTTTENFPDNSSVEMSRM